MKSQTLYIADAVNHESVSALSQALSHIEGIGRVKCISGTGKLDIEFDDGLTSPQEIENALVRAGIRLETEPRTHAAGGCCGGCGG